ncbi:hypothetical protein QMK17_19945 [Rhodococcus sp. G-MC3]|uniref:hypothetical protein n=1 Tax=Rhodococcus sp. G-MC3 TaxID=3046209 RepID=UPI0024BAFE75|nr:hypothetical protein [Rhodococcus sp. G-MC3]MDJ0395597.1 hypothetical protein [Rhodococcus sp. G-MC3]
MMHTVQRTRLLFTRFYGAHPLHLLAMCFAAALVGYVVYVAGIETFWNRNVWWQSIAVWFAGAVVAHDLVLFPLYSLADRSLTSGMNALRGRSPRIAWTVSPLNYIRIPLMGTALTFVVFFPGIIAQGSESFTSATGLTQDPYLGRWLALIACFFGVSALAYALRLALSVGSGAESSTNHRRSM